MKFSLDLIEARLPDLLRAAYRETVPLSPAWISPLDDPDHESPLTVGDRWGGPDQTCRIRIPFRIPSNWHPGTAALHVQLGEYADLSGPEALAYLDGEPWQGIDTYHRNIALGDRVRPGTDHEIVLEAYSSLMVGPQTVQALDLVSIDPEMEALYHDLRVLTGVLATLPVDSVERAELSRTLEAAYRRLDLRHLGSEEYLRSVTGARAVLRDMHRDLREMVPRTVAVGHAHIDLAWLWSVAQTRRKGARTFSTVLRLMERYPEYHFVASQPALYEIVSEDEPHLYRQIKQRIAEGRWEPTGASWVEMDCNLAGSEALVRQFLFGKRYFRDELSVDPRILWLPDVFGYSAALPQVLKGCEVDYFMTTKISWNEYNRLPHDTFRWTGIDGTPILTHMVTAPLNPDEAHHAQFYTYNAKFTPYDVAGNWTAYRQKSINHELLYLFGYGDGGGGPTAEMQETARRLRDVPGFPHVAQGSAEQFFQHLEERVWNDPDLPTWVGELYLEYHRGTYTSQGWIKRANRRAELLYREAELWSVCAGGRDAGSRLRDGWKDLLFHQFHDILPGSSIHQVYDDARRAYASIVASGDAVRTEALDRLAGVESERGTRMVVFNPAPFAREDPVEVSIPVSGIPVAADGSAAAVQRIGDVDGRGRALVALSAPSLGYASYKVSDQTDGARADAGELRIERDLLENRFFRVRLGEDGTISSLVDKRVGREIIAAGERGNRLIAFEDRPLNFDAWDIQIDYQDKPYPIDDVTSWEVVETGPLRGGVEIVRRYGASTISQRILLYRDVPRIDFPTYIDWHEHQTLLKAAFPVTVNSPRATFDIQWGNVERPTHWNTSWDWARFETCAHKWADLSEGDYGVSLLNDCKYGHDIKGHTIRLTLLKSAVYPDPEADQGEHTFSYALLPHPGDWREGETVRHAYLFNMPAAARVVDAEGETPGPLSLISADRPGLVIETVKPAEDGEGIIVRVYDAHNTRGSGTLTFARDIAHAEETNMLERSLGPVAFSGRELRLDVRPYGITTVRVRLKE